jgi:hypothetical protein
MDWPEEEIARIVRDYGVRRCRLILSNPILKAIMVSALVIER